LNIRVLREFYKLTDIHSNGGRQPTKERTLRDFQLRSKIHSLEPSKMGEVELEVKETET
jgi:hypothetical protein